MPAVGGRFDGLMSKEFRSTLWFKKGALDAEARVEATGQKDGLHPGAVDLLPPEDRYLDDGSVTQGDARAYSLRTGHTEMIPSGVRAAAAVGLGGAAVHIEELRARRPRRAVAVAALADALLMALPVYAVT